MRCFPDVCVFHAIRAVVFNQRWALVKNMDCTPGRYRRYTWSLRTRTKQKGAKDLWSSCLRRRTRLLFALFLAKLRSSPQLATGAEKAATVLRIYQRIQFLTQKAIESSKVLRNKNQSKINRSSSQIVWDVFKSPAWVSVIFIFWTSAQLTQLEDGSEWEWYIGSCWSTNCAAEVFFAACVLAHEEQSACFCLGRFHSAGQGPFAGSIFRLFRNQMRPWQYGIQMESIV